MKPLRSLARPYAKAAYNFAKNNNSLADWSYMLKKAEEIMRCPEIAQLSYKSCISSHQWHSLLADALALFFKQDKKLYTQEIDNFIWLLSLNSRIFLIPVICEMFAEYEIFDNNFLVVNVISAVTLSENQLNQLKENLSNKFHKKNMTINCTVDSKLLGGLIIRVGDTIIDGSLYGKLTKLLEFVIR